MLSALVISLDSVLKNAEETIEAETIEDDSGKKIIHVLILVCSEPVTQLLRTIEADGF